MQTVKQSSYVILVGNLEYNDETYYTTGWDIPGNKPKLDSYPTLEEAGKAAVEKLRDLFGAWMSVMDIYMDDLWGATSWDNVGFMPDMVAEVLKEEYDTPAEVINSKFMMKDVLDALEAKGWHYSDIALTFSSYVTIVELG